MENCSCCYYMHSKTANDIQCLKMILLFNLLSIWMVYISFHFPFYTKYRNTLVNILQSKHTSYHNQNFVKRNIFAVPIAVVNDWSPIVLVLGNYNLLTPLQLSCKVPFRCKAAVHTTHMLLKLYTFLRMWSIACLVARFVPMCESILHMCSHPPFSAETKPLTWQPPFAWQSTQSY